MAHLPTMASKLSAIDTLAADVTTLKNQKFGTSQPSNRGKYKEVNSGSRETRHTNWSEAEDDDMDSPWRHDSVRLSYTVSQIWGRGSTRLDYPSGKVLPLLSDTRWFEGWRRFYVSWRWCTWSIRLDQQRANCFVLGRACKGFTRELWAGGIPESIRVPLQYSTNTNGLRV